MIRELVDSSNISEVGYDPNTKTLEVRFKFSGDIYQYPNVSPETHKAFMAAESKGKYFSTYLRGLPFLKVQWTNTSDANSG